MRRLFKVSYFHDYLRIVLIAVLFAPSLYLALDYVLSKSLVSKLHDSPKSVLGWYMSQENSGGGETFSKWQVPTPPSASDCKPLVSCEQC